MARTINVKLILELRHSGMSINDIARSNHISKHSVCTVCRIAENLGITDEQVSNLSSEDLYRRFFPDKKTSQEFYFIILPILAHSNMHHRWFCTFIA